MKNVQNMHILELENVKYNDEVYLGKYDAKLTADKIIENFSIFESIVNIQTASNLRQLCWQPCFKRRGDERYVSYSTLHTAVAVFVRSCNERSVRHPYEAFMVH